MTLQEWLKVENLLRLLIAVGSEGRQTPVLVSHIGECHMLKMVRIGEKFGIAFPHPRILESESIITA